MWQSIGLTLLVIVATLACVLLFMLCGEWPRGALPYAVGRGEEKPSRTCAECGGRVSG